MSALVLVVTACGPKASSPSAGPTTTYAPINAPPIPTGTGPVDVLYDASLATTMSNTIGPAFDKASGYTFVGTPASSTALASDIRNGTKQADVLVSANPSTDRGLEGSSNGTWVSWYATFATSGSTHYTVTVLNRTPHPYAADSFVEFLLGAQAYGLLTGLKLDVLLPPRVNGSVPTALNSVLPTS